MILETTVQSRHKKNPRSELSDQVQDILRSYNVLFITRLLAAQNKLSLQPSAPSSQLLVEDTYTLTRPVLEAVHKCKPRGTKCNSEHSPRLLGNSGYGADHSQQTVCYRLSQVSPLSRYCKRSVRSQVLYVSVNTKDFISSSFWCISSCFVL